MLAGTYIVLILEVLVLFWLFDFLALTVKWNFPHVFCIFTLVFVKWLEAQPSTVFQYLSLSVLWGFVQITQIEGLEKCVLSSSYSTFETTQVMSVKLVFG
jgi:hypothetical protein